MQFPKKGYPLFPSNPPLKVKILSTSILKIWLEAQPPLQRELQTLSIDHTIDHPWCLLILMTQVYLYLFVFLELICNCIIFLYVTPKLVKSVITNLDFSKVSASNCIPVVLLKIGEPELLNITEFSLDLVFQKVGRPHYLSLYLKMLREKLHG